jgi:hypothetical protein
MVSFDCSKSRRRGSLSSKRNRRHPLVNPQRGIFKPRQMAGLLSIRTVFPRRGGRVWYDEQREAHRQIYTGDESVDYAFMGTDPNSRITAGSGMRCSSRSRSSISSALRPIAISPSSRRLSSGGIPSGYELNSHSG